MSNRMNRRQFLRSSLLLGAGVGLNAVPHLRRQDPTPTAPATAEAAVTEAAPMQPKLRGVLSPVHDPVMIKADDGYYVFCTGDGIPVRKSVDMEAWGMAAPSTVFKTIPVWALEKVPGATNIWAPDISFYNGKYHLYYSVSTFGSDHSVIGLVTNKSLNFRDKDFEWVDEGLVLESQHGGGYNCIDPNLIIDADGVPWLAFGSFWTGIKMRRLDYATGKPSDEDTTLYALAYRPMPPHAVEAPFIIYHGGFYYLFVSFDACCRGADSTYRVMVGRSEQVTGPYTDRDGVPMMQGGGTQVTFPTERWRGPGHNGIMQDNGVEYIVYHAYDANNNGIPTLHIDPLVWDDEGWPSIPGEMGHPSE